MKADRKIQGARWPCSDNDFKQAVSYSGALLPHEYYFSTQLCRNKQDMSF